MKTSVKFRQLVESLPQSNADLDNMPAEFDTFLRTYVMVDGAPFSWYRRESWLKQIINEQAHTIYLAKARQVGGSVLLAAWMIWRLLCKPATHCIYVTDRQSHVNDFHHDKFTPILEGSPKLRQLVRHNANRIGRTEFVNGSVLHKISGWQDMDRARGTTAQYVVVDEAQNCALAFLGELLRVTDAVRLKNPDDIRVIITGTGDVMGSMWDQTYANSTMNEFDAEANVWRATKPDNTIAGYRIPQTLIHDPEYIAEQATKLPTAQFQREVMAQFSQGASLPLPVQIADRCYISGMTFKHPHEVTQADKQHVYLGIDWGQSLAGSATVATVLQVVDDRIPLVDILHISKYQEPDTQDLAAIITAMIQDWDLPRGHTVCDTGGNAGAEQLVSSALEHGILTKCQLLEQRDIIKTDRLDSESTIQVDKPYFVQSVLDLFKIPDKATDQPRIRIPRIKQTEWTIDHYTSQEAVVPTTTHSNEKVRFRKMAGTRDDALMSLVFAWAAFKHSTNIPEFYGGIAV